MYLCIRPSSSLVSRSYTVSLLPHGAPLRSPSLFCRKPFFRLLIFDSPGWFPFLGVTNFTKLERLHQAANRAISGCFSSSPISLFLPEDSPPLLQVTLTHFTLSSYEQVLRLPISFSISGLARLGVKPKLFRLSWKAFSSTHPLMLSFIPPRKALFAWTLPFLTVESNLSSRCSRSDPLLSCQGATLAHLDSLPPHNLVI